MMSDPPMHALREHLSFMLLLVSHIAIVDYGVVEATKQQCMYYIAMEL